jgi:hypothetical protein
VISISIDDAEGRSEMVKFLKSAKPGFPVVHDVNEAAKKAFGVEGIPMNVAVDRTGKVVAIASGDAAELDRAAAALAKSRVSVRP